MIEKTIQSAFSENWPMIFIFTAVIVTIRLVYLNVHKQKFTLYKELFMLAFLIYVMLLFYVVTFQDVNYGTNNFIPFKEILRYEVGSKLFIKNILGNIILFIPYGLFVSYILKTRKPTPILIITLITSSVIEYTQMKIGRTFDIDDIILNIVGGIIGFLLYTALNAIRNNMPKFLRRDWFLNVISVIILVLMGLYICKIM